ncbi:hypothetical protein [Streptomyces sp. NPDC101455]|uniref:hypothetical protein n=1 Tax=Streptomyces sp. NPDC101455 TaxID=3366142 RepID=UPI0037F888D4
MNRRLTARLSKLEQAVPPPPDGPVCRYHGVHCGLGAVWPLDRAVADPAGAQMDGLIDLIHEGRRKAGLPVEPSARELWAVDLHEQVPAAELAERDRELAELLAEAKAANEALEAQLRDERRGERL